MKATRISIICVLCVAAVVLAVMNVKSVTTPIKFNDTRAEREVAVKEHLIDLRAAQTEFYHVYGKYTDKADSLVIFLQTTPKKSIYKEKSLTDNHLENLKLTEEKAVKIIERAKKAALKNKKLNLNPEDKDALYAYIWANDREIIQNQLQGFRRDTIETNMIDTLYHGRYDAETIKNLVIIPYSKGDSVQFTFKIGSYASQQGEVALFEILAPFEEYLWDLDKQELANLIDTESRIEIKRRDPNGYMNLKQKDVVPGLKVGDVESPNGGHGNWE